MEPGSDTRWPALQTILKYFQAAMAAIYLILGISLIWKPEQLFNIPSSSFTVPLGGLLIAYGILRGYRAYQKSRRD